MNGPSPASILRPVLRLFGLIFIFGIPLFNRIWPSGWAWAPEQPAYLQMIWGIYATLGVFLLLAARDPARNLSLIWFTVWSSLVHAAIMTVQAFEVPENHGHLFGDVPALLVVAVLLAVLTPRGQRGRLASQ